MKNKIFNLTIIVFMIFIGTVILSGCSSKSKDSYSSIKEKGHIVIGLDDTFVPMGFKNDKGEIDGFDVDLAKEVCNRIGLKPKFQPIDWSMKETELNSGNIDLIWNGYSITSERKEKVEFTKPYLKNRQVIITLSSSKIDTINDLKGKKVAAQSASSSLEALNKQPELVSAFKGGEPILFDTNNEALMDLESGRTDAVVADEILARYYMKERGVEKYKVLKEDFGKEEYGIGVRKQDKELVKKIDKALEDMRRDGTCGKISEKWFGQNIIK